MKTAIENLEVKMGLPDEKLTQKFIEKELYKDNRTRVDYRIFNRETKSFYENTEAMTLSLTGAAILRINGESIPDDSIVIQRYIGAKDCNGKKIYEGDYLLTNEGNWCGFVVFCEGMFELTDAQGGYSTEPEWDKCEVISNIGEMDGHVSECIQKIREKCMGHSKEDTTPVVRFFNVP